MSRREKSSLTIWSRGVRQLTMTVFVGAASTMTLPSAPVHAANPDYTILFTIPPPARVSVDQGSLARYARLSTFVAEELHSIPGSIANFALLVHMTDELRIVRAMFEDPTTAVERNVESVDQRMDAVDGLIGTYQQPISLSDAVEVTNRASSLKVLENFQQAFLGLGYEMPDLPLVVYHLHLQANGFAPSFMIGHADNAVTLAAFRTQVMDLAIRYFVEFAHEKKDENLPKEFFDSILQYTAMLQETQRNLVIDADLTSEETMNERLVARQSAKIAASVSALLAPVRKDAWPLLAAMFAVDEGAGRVTPRVTDLSGDGLSFFIFFTLEFIGEEFSEEEISPIRAAIEAISAVDPAQGFIMYKILDAMAAASLGGDGQACNELLLGKNPFRDAFPPPSGN